MRLRRNFFYKIFALSAKNFRFAKIITKILVFFEIFFATRKKFQKMPLKRKNIFPPLRGGIPITSDFGLFKAKIIFFRFAHKIFSLREKILLFLVYFFRFAKKWSQLPYFRNFSSKNSSKISLHDLPRVYENWHFHIFFKIFLCYAKKRF